MLKLLFDGDCPICRREVGVLKGRDTRGVLGFEDIAREEFRAEKYGLTVKDVQSKMHGVWDDGSVISGADVFREVYGLLGYKTIVFISRLPVIRQIVDLGYLIFARNRMRIGRLLGRKCDNESCML